MKTLLGKMHYWHLSTLITCHEYQLTFPQCFKFIWKMVTGFFFYFSMKRKLAILPAACQQVHFENVDNPLPNYMLVSPISPRPSPCTGLSRPWVFWRFRLPNFKTFRCMKVVRLSAPSTGRFYTPGNIPGIHVG